MGSNSFGNIFKITTWGESHGKAIGVVIDGCPAGLPITAEEINQELGLRRPGRNAYTSPRQEEDVVDILSGVFEGQTTGAPISLMILNKDGDSSKYEPIKDLLRPGHANFTYEEKYGIFDYRGGGRSSARETAARVAAGAIAKKILAHFNIHTVAYIKEIGGLSCGEVSWNEHLKAKVLQSPLFCPDEEMASLMMQEIEKVKQEGDSLGGIVELITVSLPVGLGDPIYEKLEANLAKAMLTLPATKGVEFGAGFQASRMRGSQHNDSFTLNSEGKIVTATNFAGGTLGGISTGMPLVLRVAFKPTSSLKLPQPTLDKNKQVQNFVLPEGSRHDPCVAIRAVPVIEAMGALVIADALLKNRSVRL